MRILVLDRPESWHVNDLRRAAGDSHEIETASYLQLAASIQSAGGVSNMSAGILDVSKFDGVITRAMPGGSLEQVVFRMDWLGQLQAQLQIPVINPARAIEASVDKYLTLEKIRSAGVSVPSSFVAQTASQALDQFQKSGGDTVIKPLFGSRGVGIERLQDRSEAETTFEKLEQQGRVIYQQQFVCHGDSDIRLLVVGDEVMGMRRHRPGHWITNISCGGEPEFFEPGDQETRLALLSARAVGATLAGIDILHDQRTGQPLVVEVNSAPSWKAIATVNERDPAELILNTLRSMA